MDAKGTISFSAFVLSSEREKGREIEQQNKGRREKETYIYIYMHAVESITGPSLGVFKVNNWSKFVFF